MYAITLEERPLPKPNRDLNYRMDKSMGRILFNIEQGMYDYAVREMGNWVELLISAYQVNIQIEQRRTNRIRKLYVNALRYSLEGHTLAAKMCKAMANYSLCRATGLSSYRSLTIVYRQFEKDKQKEKGLF